MKPLRSKAILTVLPSQGRAAILAGPKPCRTERLSSAGAGRRLSPRACEKIQASRAALGARTSGPWLWRIVRT
jgi:hypothetical protein